MRKILSSCYYEEKMEYITVGEVLKAQGIAGEIKVRSLSDSAERFAKLRVVYVENKPYKILNLRIDREYVYLRLQGVENRTVAETLRGKFLQIDRVHAVDLKESEYFIADLIGCELIADDCPLGAITDILQNGGGADVINVRAPSGKELRFPFLNRIVKEVDVECKRFVVYRKLLDEVCVYDD